MNIYYQLHNMANSNLNLLSFSIFYSHSNSSMHKTNFCHEWKADSTCTFSFCHDYSYDKGCHIID